MVNPVDDIARYFHFHYILVYCLAAVVVIGTVVAWRRRQYAKISLVYSTIACVGLASNLYFMGVMLDNGAPLEGWTPQSWPIFLGCGVLWVVQLVFSVSGKGRGRRK